MYIARSLLFFVLITISWGALALSGFTSVDKFVLAEMKRQGVVGLSIGIIQGSKVVYTQGYGFSDLKARTPVSENTAFNWASNSKPLMAVAALQLVEEKRLELDRGVGAYIPELPPHLQRITTRQLLSHQSGIPDYSSDDVVPWGQKATPREELDPFNSLRRFAMSPLLYSPGSKMEYSSSAFVLLSAVVQSAGRIPINKQLARRIVAPLGLDSFQLDMPFSRQLNWSRAYKVNRGEVVQLRDYAHFWKHGAAGYKSNIKDFSKFAAALLNRELLTPSMSDAMWKQQAISSGELFSYGLGVWVSGQGRNLRVSHNGAQDETRTRMVVYPNQGHGLVVMCNTQSCEPEKFARGVYGVLNRR